MWILAKLLSLNIYPSKISSSENVIASLVRIHLPFQLIDKEIQLLWVHEIPISFLSCRRHNCFKYRGVWWPSIFYSLGYGVYPAHLDPSWLDRRLVMMMENVSIWGLHFVINRVWGSIRAAITKVIVIVLVIQFHCFLKDDLLHSLFWLESFVPRRGNPSTVIIQTGYPICHRYDFLANSSGFTPDSIL